MILCDIGNTSYHFLKSQKSFKKDVEIFDPKSIEEKVYYISVNAHIDALVFSLKNWINLKNYIDIKNYYKTMGIDRIVACEAVTHGIIVDAGSAITVDIVQDGIFMGGFILPGVNAMQKTYANLSSALDYSFNFECDLDIIPKNSKDAISYGFLKTLYLEVMSHNLPITLIGGDAIKFKKIFIDAKIDEMLIFNSMKQIIQKAKLC